MCFEGRTFLIVESRSRLGGRVFTSDELGSDVAFDLGASWIHHFGPSNPVTRDAWANGAVVGVPPNGVDMFMATDGRQEIRHQDFVAAGRAYNRMEEIREAAMEEHADKWHKESHFHKYTYQQYTASLMTNTPSSSQLSSSSDPASSPSPPSSPDSSLDPTRFYDPSSCTSPSVCASDDCSFAAFLRRSDVGALQADLTPVSRSLFDAFVGDIQAYEGASFEQLSAMHCFEECDGVPECNMQFMSGYGNFLLDQVARHQLAHVLDTEVHTITYTADHVEVLARHLTSPSQRRPTSHGFSSRPRNSSAGACDPGLTQPTSESRGTEVRYEAKFVLVTVPLGVLKRECIRFEPPLPRAKLEAIRSLGFGLLNKVALRFPRPFWSDGIAPSPIDGSKPHLNILNISQPECTFPLWIVNASPGARAFRDIRRAQDEAGLKSHGREWMEYAKKAVPMSPFLEGGILGERSHESGKVSEENHANQPTTTHHGNEVAASAVIITASDPDPTPVASSSSCSSSSSSPPPSDGPHVLISFYQTFDTVTPDSIDGRMNASSHESQTDDEIIATLMKQLRRAFQGGVEDKIDPDTDAGADTNTASSPTRMIHTGVVPSQSQPIEHTQVNIADIDGSTVDLPHAFEFAPCALTSVVSPATVVPDPIRYVITRWGLEPYSHGAYTHYTPGTGMHTCAELSRPVNGSESDDGVTRLLFAGEATQGVHLGCADGAWLSGLREARRIQQLWKDELC